MRTRAFFGILIVGLLFSSYSINKDCYRIIARIVDNENIDTIIPISGCWISEDYVNSLKEYKSPKKAQDNSILIIIPESISENVTIMYDFHDDFDYFKIVRNNNKYEIWENLNEQMPILLYSIKVISESKIVIGETVFTRINPVRVEDFLHIGLKSELLVQEEILFKGVYLSSQGNKVVFKNNGQIEGLDGFSYYKPESDYYDQGMQIDQLILVKSASLNNWQDIEYYGFKFNHDTLKLYKLNCIEFDSLSQHCALVELGKLEYTLLKINNNR